METSAPHVSFYKILRVPSSFVKNHPENCVNLGKLNGKLLENKISTKSYRKTWDTITSYSQMIFLLPQIFMAFGVS